MALYAIHNSPIYNEWHCHENDGSKDTPQPIGEFQVSFPLLRIKINQDKPKSTVKGSQLETHL